MHGEHRYKELNVQFQRYWGSDTLVPVKENHMGKCLKRSLGYLRSEYPNIDNNWTKALPWPLYISAIWCTRCDDQQGTKTVYKQMLKENMKNYF